jgi:hypothetical protein
MLTDNQIRALRAPFPAEALSPDTSRGFELTSIKAAFIIERLNDVFGTCGTGWRYVHAPFETLVMADERTEILTEVALQYRVSTDEQRGCPPLEWRDGWRPDHDRERVWSEPVYAVGGHALGRGGAPYTDARKSAVTDGLTKAASMLGVGHDVFKGLVRTSAGNGHSGKSGDGNGRRGNGQPHDESDATAFWKLYNQVGKAAGLSLETAKALTTRGDWAGACSELQTLIDRSASAAP